MRSVLTLLVSYVCETLSDTFGTTGGFVWCWTCGLHRIYASKPTSAVELAASQTATSIEQNDVVRLDVQAVVTCSHTDRPRITRCTQSMVASIIDDTEREPCKADLKAASPHYTPQHTLIMIIVSNDKVYLKQ